MEILAEEWLNEFEVDEDCAVLHRMNSLDDLTPEQLAAMFEIDSPSSDQTSYERPTKQLKSTASQEIYVDRRHASKSGRGRKRTREGGVRAPCTQEHVMAERRRREKLSQQFIALSALVPGLKKTDKASVLGDCMNYIKQLQERVKTLEEKISVKSMETTIFVKKFQVTSDTDSSSDGGSGSDYSREPLPEIQVKGSDRNVLIKIHCEKQKDIVAHMLLEIEKLNLSVISSNVTPFGSLTFDLTILAQMDAEFNMSVMDLVKKLRSFVVQFSGEDCS